MKVRLLAKVTGKVISLFPAIGDITQIMTRGLFTVTNSRDHWDQVVNINDHSICIRDLLFWRDNIASIEPIPLLGKATENIVFFWCK